MGEVLPFFIILVSGLIFSAVFYRFHLPWVIALIVAGIVIGPSGFSLFEPTTTLTFLAEVGLIFLMFMAGLETRFSSFKELSKRIAVLSFLSATLPFIVGVLVGMLFGFSGEVSILLGIIFISSSIAVVIPLMETHGLMKRKLGKTIMAATVVNDVLSLVLLSVFLQTFSPISKIPLPLFYTSLFIILVALRWGMPRTREFFAKFGRSGNAFEKDIRVVVTILLGIVVLFEVLGLHPITAGFLAGLVLSESIKTEELKEKIHTLSYGIFIPVFFVVLGLQTNIRVFFEAGNALVFSIVLVATSTAAKFISGWIGGLVNHFSHKESALIGASTIPQLSTTLAVVFAGSELGILNNTVITGMIILSISTTFIGPLIISKLAKDIEK